MPWPDQGGQSPANLYGVLSRLHLPSLLRKRGKEVSLFFSGRGWGDRFLTHLEGKPREVGTEPFARRAGPSARAAATPAGRGREAAGPVCTHAAALAISGGYAVCSSAGLRWTLAGHRGEARPS